MLPLNSKVICIFKFSVYQNFLLSDIQTISHTKCIGISISISYVHTKLHRPRYKRFHITTQYVFFCLNYIAGKLRLFQVVLWPAGSAVFFTTISYKAHLHKNGNINNIRYVFYLKMFSFQEQFNKVFSHTWIIV